jgi:anti-sigma factor RsiW
MSLPTSHLGDRLTAFVDGELDHDARERVLVHLARCAECRQAVDAERQTKSRLTSAPDPQLPPGLTANLVGIGTSMTADRRVLRRHVVPRRRRRATAQHRRRRVAASSGAALVGAMSAAFALGGGPAEGTPITPNVNRFTVEHATVSDEVVPLTDRGSSAVVVSFTVPAAP